MFPLDEVIRQANKCTGCGFCLDACPIYQVLGIETLASRGRVDTIRGLLTGDLKPTDRMEGILSTCMLCMACQSACPSGVPIQELILLGRHWAVEEKGLPFIKRLVFRKLLKDRRALGLAFRLAKRFMQLGPEAPGRPLRHLPTIFSGLAGGRTLPPLADSPLSRRVLESLQPRSMAGTRGKVALFAGCYLEFVDTPIGEAGIRVLASQGYEILYPHGQVCCGAPVLYSGDLEGALELARINARAFSDLDTDTVVTLCATCGSALRKGYQTLAAHLDGSDAENVMTLSEKVMDISEFLGRQPSLQGLSREIQMTLTYHDPCHHIRVLGIREEPRKLLQDIPGAKLVEMADPAQCCGGGGSFSLTHPHISLDVGRSKLNNILATGAQALVTACPGCILQIQDVALHEQADIEVLHLAEVLDRALLRTSRS